MASLSRPDSSLELDDPVGAVSIPATSAPLAGEAAKRPVGRNGRNGRGPNLRDVAAVAEVSVATVSLVLNDSDRISRSTKLRVRQVMDELKYQPNRLAQSLSGKYTKVVGVLLPALRHAFADAYFGELLSGISDEAHAGGYKILLEQAKPEYVAERKHIELFERRYVDGVLLLGTSDDDAFIADFAEGSFPALVVDNRIELPANTGHAQADFVMSDYLRGAEQAMNYLRQLGHRKIGLLMAAPNISTTRQVTEAWRRHCRAALGEEAAACDTLVEDGEFTERGGAGAMARLLKAHPDVTAVLATNDKMAIGAMHLLDRRGIRVPADISVVGFDDLQHAAFVVPSLTTIHLPLYEVGRQAFGALMARIQNKSPAVAATLRTHLVVRDSTAMAAGRKSE